MSIFTVNNVKIVGLSACVPAEIEDNRTLPIFSSDDEAKKVILSTGIQRHRKVPDGVTASDLTVVAVNAILDDLNWLSEDVDCLFYVSTSRDFIAPQTACILQEKLHLRNDCFVMDLPLGCSGWVYGMSVIGSMMANGNLKKGLLIAAETNTKNRSMKDRTVRPLFGDAATVTALEFSADANPMRFSFGVDGTGYQAVWAKYGGMRFPADTESVAEIEIEPGIIRKGTDMVVNGMDVFAFAIKVPPRAIKEFMDLRNLTVENIDLLLLHQANKFIDEKIRKSLKFPIEKVPYSLEDFGNVTSASIPLTLVTRCKKELEKGMKHILACGFGVGLAWGTMDFYIEKPIITNLSIYPSKIS